MKKIDKMKMFFRNLLTQFGAVNTDKGQLIWNGNEDLKEGMDVFVEDADNDDLEYQPAENGDYTTEDGKIITVVDGKVAAITDPKAEVAEQANEETPAENEDAPAEMAEETPAVENPTNEGEETDTEAIVELRKEVNELYARMDAMEEMLRKLSEKPAAMSAVEQSEIATVVEDSLGKQRLSCLRK